MQINENQVRSLPGAFFFARIRYECGNLFISCECFLYVRVDILSDDTGALTQELPGDRQADAAACSRHKNGFALEGQGGSLICCPPNDTRGISF